MLQQKTRNSEALTESLAFKSRWNFIEQTNLFGLINTLILALLDEAWFLDQWRFPTHYLCADWIVSTSCMRVHSTRKGIQFFTSHVQLSWYLQRRQERELKCQLMLMIRLAQKWILYLSWKDALGFWHCDMTSSESSHLRPG